jgi:uncharacterized membrane protein YdbT with pleckstrin-like domain
MGRYIDDILQPDEKVLLSTTLHWKIYFPALVTWIGVGACLFGAWTVLDPTAVLFLLAMAAVVAALAIYLTVRAWFSRWTTETDVTNFRVVHKEGFIQRETFEMSMDKIESVDVVQSVPGRILGYGDVTIRGVGEGGRVIRQIASPIEFRNFITAR